MDKIDIGTGIGYYNLFIPLKMNNLVISVSYIITEKGTPTRNYTNRIDMFHILRYFPRGRGIVHIEDRNYTITPGTFYLMAPGVLHGQTSDASDPMDEYTVCFDITVQDEDKRDVNSYIQDEVDKVIAKLAASKFLIGKDCPSDENARIHDKIIDELEKPKMCHYAKLHSLFYEIFINAVRAFSSTSELHCNDHMALKRSKYSLRLLINAIFFYRIKELTLTELAGRLNMSTRQTERILKRNFGMSFKEKLLSMRMHKVKEAITEYGMPIKQAAEEVGLQSMTYFYTVFKNCEGMTPAEYRKRYLNSVSKDTCAFDET